MILSSPRLSNRFEIVSALVVAALAVAVGAAVGREQISLVLLIVGGGAGLIAILKHPAFGAALILLLAPLEGAIMFQGHSAVKLATILCAAILVTQVTITRREIEFDRTTWLTVALVGWAFTTILWSPDQASSLSNWFSFALQSFLYFLLLNLILSKPDLKLALWGHVLGGLALSIIVTNTIVAREFLRKEDVAGMGLNLAARIIGLNLLLSILLYQLETRRLARVVLLISTILAGVGVVVALSRGTWYGVVVSLSVLGLISVLKGKFRFHFGQLLLWSLGGFVLFYVLNTFLLDEHGLWKLTYRFQSALTLSDAAGHRFDIWRVGWAMFSDAPLWGHGFDSFAHKFPYYLARSGLSDIFYSWETKQPHNAFVFITADLGLIGLFLFLAVLVSVFRKVWGLLHEDQANTSALAWGMALFAFLIIASTVDSAVDRKYLWYTLSLITLMIRYWGNGQSKNIEMVRKDIK